MKQHQCYYCDQFFSSKEKLYDHLEEHSNLIDKPLNKICKEKTKKKKKRNKK
jgi:hypothetical protein